MTDEKIEEMVEEKVLHQYMTCRKNYYKNMLRLFIGSVSTTVLILIGIISWSYKPIADIAVLKSEVIQMNKKIDIIIENEKDDKKDALVEDSLEETKMIKVSIMDIATPALGAVCQSK